MIQYYPGGNLLPALRTRLSVLLKTEVGDYEVFRDVRSRDTYVSGPWGYYASTNGRPLGVLKAEATAHLLKNRRKLRDA